MAGSEKLYKDIYEKTKRELDGGSFDSSALFEHCMNTCRALFDVASYKVGKPPINIPNQLVEELGNLYDKKFDDVPKDSMPKGKYDYATSHKNFSTQEKFSMQDLANIMKPSMYEINAPDNPVKDEVKQIYQQYLPGYFGYEYKNDISEKGVKYELIRLTKILYDCKVECEVSLGALERVSLVKFKSEIPSKYQKAINFIKERIIIRNRDSDFHLAFQNIIELERYKNATQSFLASFLSRRIDNIIYYVSSPSCRSWRYVTEQVCRIILENLRLSKVGIQKRYKNPEAVQYYAYTYFLMTDMESASIPKADSFYVEFNESEYDAIDCFRESVQEKEEFVSDIESFAIQYKKELLPLIFPNENLLQNSRKITERINRHKHYYSLMAGIYNRGRNRKDTDPIEIKDAVILIRLYEQLNSDGYDIPLYSGYSGTKRKSQKIKQLLKKIEAFISKQPIKEPLNEEEFFLASYWLFDRMMMLVRYLTIELYSLMEETRKTLLTYWMAGIPLLTEDGFRVPLNELAERLLPQAKMQEILNDVQKI